MQERETATTADRPSTDRDELIARIEFVEATLDSLEEGIVACDADGTLVLFNAATRTFHGLPSRALPPEEWADHYDLYTEDGARLLTTGEIPLFRALAGEDVHGAGMVIDPVDGDRRELRATGRQVRDADGQLLGAVVAMHDVTRRRAAEAAAAAARVRVQEGDRLRHEASRLEQLQAATLRILETEDVRSAMWQLAQQARSLLEGSSAGVTWVDEAGVGQQILVGDAHDEHHEVCEPLPVDGIGEASLSVRRAQPWTDATLAMLDQVLTVGAQAVRMHGLHQRLADARTAELRDELMAAVSHDMQTPVSTMLGLTELFVERPEALDDETRDAAIQALRRQAVRLRWLVGQFIDFSRLTSLAALELRVAPAALADVVTSVTRLHEHDGRLRVHIHEHPTVEADADRIERLIGNLVNNALRYSEGPVDLTVSTAAGDAVVVVTDQGPGLGPTPDALFEKFVRGSSAGDTEGTGLGLYVSREVAHAHGGTLHASNGAQGGACFTLHLPLHREER